MSCPPRRRSSRATIAAVDNSAPISTADDPLIVNDPPYGNERAYNALRLAGTLAAKEGQSVRLFLMADAVACAMLEQKVPEGYYNVQPMVGKLLRKSEVLVF